MARGPERYALQMLLFVGILVALNGVFWLLGVHEHIDIVGSVVLTLVITGLFYAFYAMRGGGR